MKRLHWYSQSVAASASQHVLWRELSPALYETVSALREVRIQLCAVPCPKDKCAHDREVKRQTTVHPPSLLTCQPSLQ